MAKQKKKKTKKSQKRFEKIEYYCYVDFTSEQLEILKDSLRCLMTVHVRDGGVNVKRLREKRRFASGLLKRFDEEQPDSYTIPELIAMSTSLWKYKEVIFMSGIPFSEDEKKYAYSVCGEIISKVEGTLAMLGVNFD